MCNSCQSSDHTERRRAGRRRRMFKPSGKVAVVKRPDHVICEAFDEDMNPITVEGFGLFARALCHETDHLDGILYPDVAEEPARDVTMEEVE